MKLKIGTILLAAALVAAGSYADPILISVTGTADSTAVGYTSGQSYTFNWVINESYAGNTTDSFAPNSNFWFEESAMDSMVYSSVSGGGITGTYKQPSLHSSSPRSYLRSAVGRTQFMEMYVGRDSGTTGLKIDDVDITRLHGYSVDLGVNFAFPTPTLIRRHTS